MKTIFISIPWMQRRAQTYTTELQRLEAKYGRALNKQEMAHELNISVKQLERRMAEMENIPNYVEMTGKTGNIFPITEVAKFFAENTIHTTNYKEGLFDDQSTLDTY